MIYYRALALDKESIAQWTECKFPKTMKLWKQPEQNWYLVSSSLAGSLTKHDEVFSSNLVENWV